MKNEPQQHSFPLTAAYGLAVANALIIGLSFSFVKVAVTLAGPVGTLAFRFVIALAVCVSLPESREFDPGSIGKIRSGCSYWDFAIRWDSSCFKDLACFMPRPARRGF